MAKRRNKNKKAGPVKLIRPEPVAMPEQSNIDAPVASADLGMDEQAMHAHADAQGSWDLDAVSADAPVEAAASPDWHDLAEDARAEAPSEEESAESAAAPAPETDAVELAEMDMPPREPWIAPRAENEPIVPDVDDASGALADATTVDPSTITSKAATLESIRIVDTAGEPMEMREQVIDDADASAAPWGSAITSAPVSFDLPDGDAEAQVDAPSVAAPSGKKSDRKLKLNKLQKHARGATTAEAPAVEAPVADVPETEAPAPKPRRERDMSAFAKLTEYQQLSLEHVPGLPEEADVAGHWRGVGFGLGGRRLVSPFDEVIEIMRMPQVTHVPGTQPWMLGVANVRGTLLPVVDLKQFLEGERTVMHEGQRVLVVRQAGGNVAVLIDQLYGQRTFNDSQKVAAANDDSRYGYFIKQVYRVGDNDWGVFSMSMLTRTPEFRQAAA